MPIKDKISEGRIELLHPRLRNEVLSLIEEIEIGFPSYLAVRVTSTYRSFEEQDKLYAQGRTTKGRIVTNAKGGQSYHNYGLALDFVLLLNKKEVSWDTVIDRDFDGVPDWFEVINTFKAKGWVSGVDFKTFKDLPHLEKTFGLDHRTLKSRLEAGDSFKDGGNEYVNLD